MAHYLKKYYPVFWLFLLGIMLVCLSSLSDDINMTVWIGRIFLTQTSLLVCISIWKLLRKKGTKKSLWASILVANIILIVFSFCMYHFGSRVITESDGHSTIVYQCYYSGHNPSHIIDEQVCVLMFMPTAAGNLPVIVSGERINWNNSTPEIISLGMLELLLIFGIVGLRALERFYDSPSKNKSD